MDTSMVDPSLVLRLVAAVQAVPWAGPVLVWMPVVCMVAGMIDANVPVPPAGSPWVWPRRLVHALAWSYGFARNLVSAGYKPAEPASHTAVTHLVPVLALALAGSVVACGPPQMAQPVTARAVQDSHEALAAYQAALGIAKVAVGREPALAARVDELAAALLAAGAPAVEVVPR